MSIDPKKLLRNKKVIDEINRHKWLESEIAGYDIGFEAATEDWLENHAAAWISYHLSPKKAVASTSKSSSKKSPKKR